MAWQENLSEEDLARYNQQRKNAVYLNPMNAGKKLKEIDQQWEQQSVGNEADAAVDKYKTDAQAAIDSMPNIDFGGMATAKQDLKTGDAAQGRQAWNQQMQGLANTQNMLQQQAAGANSVARQEGAYQQGQLAKSIASQLASQRGFDPGMAAQALAAKGQGQADIAASTSLAAAKEKQAAIQALTNSQLGGASLGTKQLGTEGQLMIGAQNADQQAWKNQYIQDATASGMSLEEAENAANFEIQNINEKYNRKMAQEAANWNQQSFLSKIF